MELISTSAKVFAHQSTPLAQILPKSNLFFVPPFNLFLTPNTVDNIPLIEPIGSVTYSGGLKTSY
jgi:hypothetical protein